MGFLNRLFTESPAEVITSISNLASPFVSTTLHSMINAIRKHEVQLRVLTWLYPGLQPSLVEGGVCFEKAPGFLPWLILELQR